MEIRSIELGVLRTSGLYSAIRKIKKMSGHELSFYIPVSFEAVGLCESGMTDVTFIGFLASVYP